MSGRRDLNPRQPAWEAGTLPAELRPHDEQHLREESERKSSRWIGEPLAQDKFSRTRPGFEDGLLPLRLGFRGARARVADGHRPAASGIRPATARVMLRDAPLDVRGAPRVERAVAALNQIHRPRRTHRRRGGRSRRGFAPRPNRTRLRVFTGHAESNTGSGSPRFAPLHPP